MSGAQAEASGQQVADEIQQVIEQQASPAEGTIQYLNTHGRDIEALLHTVPTLDQAHALGQLQWRSADENEMNAASSPRFNWNGLVTGLFEDMSWPEGLRKGAALAANAVATAGAFALGQTGQPVRAWTWAPAVVYLSNDVPTYIHFEATNNNLIDAYYENVPFQNDMVFSHSAGTNTRTYFSWQLGHDAGVVAQATTSLLGGFYGAQYYLGPIFNSTIHVIPGLSPLIQIGRMLYLRQARYPTGEFGSWFAWIVSLKAGRSVYRSFLATLPAYPPAVILTALGVAGGLGMARDWMVGDYIEAIAKYLHFRAYDEQGWLRRSHDCYLHQSAQGLRLRFEHGRASLIPGYVPNAGPASRTIQALFVDDFRGHFRNTVFVGDLLKEPCGWQVIAHKISQL